MLESKAFSWWGPQAVFAVPLALLAETVPPECVLICHHSLCVLAPFPWEDWLLLSPSLPLYLQLMSSYCFHQIVLPFWRPAHPGGNMTSRGCGSSLWSLMGEHLYLFRLQFSLCPKESHVYKTHHFVAVVMCCTWWIGASHCLPHPHALTFPSPCLIIKIPPNEMIWLSLIVCIFMKNLELQQLWILITNVRLMNIERTGALLKINTRHCASRSAFLF